MNTLPRIRKPPVNQPFPKYAARVPGHWWGGGLRWNTQADEEQWVRLHLFEGDAPWLIGTYQPLRAQCGKVIRNHICPTDFPEEDADRVCRTCLRWVRQQRKAMRSR